MIVGLGNPGSEYTGTPHNVGFDVADALIERWGLRRTKERFRGRLAEGRAGRSPADSFGVTSSGELPNGGPEGASDTDPPRVATPLRVAVLEPQTYMNEAGRSVGPARGSFKLPLERVLVVHDEIDLPFGEVRTRVGGGLAGHNGLKSIKRELGGADFARVRVGVGRPDSTDPEIVSGYVLGRWRQSRDEVADLIERGAAAVERVVLAGELE